MKCFYHNDLDGHCAGAIVQKFYEYPTDSCVEYIEIGYNDFDKFNEVKEGDTVYIVDISFTEKTLPYLLNVWEKCGRSLRWIDHHQSSVDMREKYQHLNDIGGIVESGNSGAYLTWRYLFPHDKVPYAVRLVDDYDCWKLKIEDSTFFKLGMETLKDYPTDVVWCDLFNDDDCSKIIVSGKSIHTWLMSFYNHYCSYNSYETNIGGHAALVLNLKTNSWAFGQRVNDYPIVCGWVFDGKRYNYSLYSVSNIVDCAKIAESYGGGGHKGAAGFVSDKLLFAPADKTDD